MRNLLNKGTLRGSMVKQIKSVFLLFTSSQLSNEIFLKSSLPSSNKYYSTLFTLLSNRTFSKTRSLLLENDYF